MVLHIHAFTNISSEALAMANKTIIKYAKPERERERKWGREKIRANERERENEMKAVGLWKETKSLCTRRHFRFTYWFDRNGYLIIVYTGFCILQQHQRFFFRCRCLLLLKLCTSLPYIVSSTQSVIVQCKSNNPNVRERVRAVKTDSWNWNKYDGIVFIRIIYNFWIVRQINLGICKIRCIWLTHEAQAQ